MKVVLITGMSGTGKTSLLNELSRRGHRTVDTDYGDYHEVIDGERVWRVDRIDLLLTEVEQSNDEGLLFVQGTTRNQGLFYPRFARIILLSAPIEVLVHRLRARTNNPYGKDPSELAETLENVRTVEPLLRRAATIEIVTTIPISRVADLALEHSQA